MRLSLRLGLGDMSVPANPVNKPIVVATGATGFIGARLISKLVRDFHVIALDRPGPPFPPAIAECVDFDITNDDSVGAAVEMVRARHGERVAAVIHLAAFYDFSGTPSANYEKVNVRGTERLVRALQSLTVEQFIYASSMLVHAPAEPGQFITEDWPMEPKWAYPQSKLDAERTAVAHRGAMPVVLARLAGVYDDFCRSPTLAHQIQRIYERRLVSHVFPGHISHGQAFLHLDDLADFVLALIGHRAQLPLPVWPVLVGEPEVIAYDELQHSIAWLLHGEGWETRQIPKALAKAGAWIEDVLPGEEPFIKPWMIDMADDHFALDIERARSVLGWQPRHSLRATLPKMIAALRADPRGWYRANRLTAPNWLNEQRAANDNTNRDNTDKNNNKRHEGRAAR